MTSNLSQISEDLLVREYYRQLSIAGIQEAAYTGGVGDATLELFCRIYAAEALDLELYETRSDYDNHVFSAVIRAAHGYATADFEQSWQNAIASCQYAEKQWQLCLDLDNQNPEALRRLASSRDWLAPEEEQMNGSELSKTRIAQLHQMARHLMEQSQ